MSGTPVPPEEITDPELRDLAEQGLISVIAHDGEIYVTVTEEGKQTLRDLGVPEP